MSRIVINPYRVPRPMISRVIDTVFRSQSIPAVHRSLPEYAPTPLVSLPSLAARLGIGRLLVKDESYRFGLAAFKALGSTYAVYRLVCGWETESGRPEPRPETFYSEEPVLSPGTVTLCTATDGNHGRGVAWTARKLQQNAVIYMPANTVPARIASIRREGAEVVVVNGNYDNAVTRAAHDAAANGWHVISDTSWEGYENIPRHIMAGYTTTFAEIDEQLSPDDRLDVVLVQGGVGALAAAASWYYRRSDATRRPHLISVEPDDADCLLESIRSGDGKPVTTTGNTDSIMAGLNCGTPSPTAWPLIRDGFDVFMSLDDDACRRAVRMYHTPLGDDFPIASGESGAAGLAGLVVLAGESVGQGMRERIGLTPDRTVLVLNTEGVTDPVSHRTIVGG
ncbi:MAG: diaminopropionate ammonia-lyase [candidate division Zixibacteria bacterium]|nr:diaminopropionate ammonia-lyase [candidate division Zixibacteria bacterium]